MCGCGEVATELEAAGIGALVHGTICINVRSNVVVGCCYDGVVTGVVEELVLGHLLSI